MTVMLALEAMTAGYGSLQVVRSLDLEVRSGEVVALLGPSGAGKTTTLMAVSQLIRPMSGSVRLAGDDIVGWRPERVAAHGCGHVPEGRAIFDGLTVRENLRVSTPRGADLDRALTYFPELERLMGRQAGLLSGGEQQMLALARAIVRNPVVLMIDELSLGLAPVVVERLLPVLRQIADDQDVAVLMVEQQIDAALQVADRGYVINHGELVTTGSAAELAADAELVASSYLGVTDHQESDD